MRILIGLDTALDGSMGFLQVYRYVSIVFKQYKYPTTSFGLPAVSQAELLKHELRIEPMAFLGLGTQIEQNVGTCCQCAQICVDDEDHLTEVRGPPDEPETAGS